MVYIPKIPAVRGGGGRKIVEFEASVDFRQKFFHLKKMQKYIKS